jgi:hypothetical protein
MNSVMDGVMNNAVDMGPAGAMNVTVAVAAPGESINQFAAKFGRSIREQISSAWTKLAKLGRDWRPRTARQLRLCETLPLGERRFVSVVQFEEQKFLIGSAANSVVLLTRLEKQENVAAPPGRHFKKKPATDRRRKQKSK